MADTNHKYVSEDGLTTLISLTKAEIAKKADDSAVVKKINGIAPDSEGNITLDTGAGTVQSINGIAPDDNGNVSLPQIDNSGTVTSTVSYEIGTENIQNDLPIKILVEKDAANTIKSDATIGNLAISEKTAYDNITGLGAVSYFLKQLIASLQGCEIDFENTDYTYKYDCYSYGNIKGFVHNSKSYEDKLFTMMASTVSDRASSPMDGYTGDTWLAISKNWVTPSELTAAISALTAVKFSVVDALPTTGEDGVIYLVAHSHTDDDDTYDEYIWLSSTSKFEKIGNTDIDLSGYLKATDVTTIDSTAVTTLWNSIAI